MEGIRIFGLSAAEEPDRAGDRGSFLAITFLGQKLSLKILREKLLVIFRRFAGISPFRSYALVDGIGTVLTWTRPGLQAKPPPNLKLDLLPAWAWWRRRGKTCRSVEYACSSRKRF